MDEKINKLVVFCVSAIQCTLIFGGKHLDKNNNKWNTRGKEIGGSHVESYVSNQQDLLNTGFHTLNCMCRPTWTVHWKNDWVMSTFKAANMCLKTQYTHGRMVYKILWWQLCRIGILLLPTVYEKPLSLHGMACKSHPVNCSCRLPYGGSNMIDWMQLVHRYFLGRGGCRCVQKAHACISVPMH